MARLRFPVIALACLISSHAWADLRTYDVDPQYRDEMYNALRRILEPQPGQVTKGQVQLLPSGQILVNADPPTLDQVEKVLQALRARPAPPAPRVSLRYWAVLGTPSQGNAPGIGGPPPPAVPPPAALNDVIAELKRLHGDLTYRVLGTAAVATVSGQDGHVQGTPLSVDQTAYVQGDTLNATISMELKSIAGLPIGNSTQLGNLTLSTTLHRGEFVVLGEAHFQEQVTGLEGPVFYIVHWEK
jgi:hypothetical protein